MQTPSSSPRELLAHLAPVLQLDGELIGGLRLSDCYRLDAREPVRLELRDDRRRIELQVEPAPEQPRHRPLATAAGLELSYRNTDELARSPELTQLAEAACKRLAELLHTQLGDAPRRWILAEPSLRELAEPVAAEITCTPAELHGDPDHALLARDFRGYQRLYGVRPEPLAVSVQGRPVPGICVHYPRARNGRVPNSASVYATSLRIAHRRRMRRYFASIGFVFDDAAEIRTVPTPTTYAGALAGRPELARVRPRMLAGFSASLQPIHWGALVRRNLLPVSVAPDYSVALHERMRDIGPLDQIPCDIGMLPHDMGLHAAGLHAVPAAAWDELVALALERVRKRALTMVAGRWGVLGRLAAFFEGPITTHCWRAWQEADEPEDFAGCFAPHFRELLAALREL